MAEQVLKGTRVLVIRPRRQPDSFCKLLQASGAEVEQTPVLSIQPAANQQGIKDLIIDFDNTDIAIFVSVNAARIATQWLDSYWPMLPVGVDYFAVGKGTAAVLNEAGIEAVSAQQQNSEGLLELPQLQQVEGKRVTIFRGVGGRELLSEQLTHRGARVQYCELYHRQPEPEQIALARNQLASVQVLVAHSGELLQALGSAEHIQQTDLQLVVPGQRVAAIAAELGYCNISVAENAGPEAMLSALQKGLQDCHRD